MITLTSDFGLKDPYVAEMKGVILTINPKATLIDITHKVEKYDIRMAAFILASASPYFPVGTINLAVVDPGVGTQRRAIVVQSKNSYFVGPDNGLLILAAQNQSIEHVYELKNSKYMLTKVSSTFHGRDIFAPAAAYLDKGVTPSEFGPEVKDPVIPNFSKVTHSSDSLIGEVLHIDDFGNIITNIAEQDLPYKDGEMVKIGLANKLFKLTFTKAYAEARPKENLLLIGSHGFLEIAQNQATAAENLHAKIGDKIVIMKA